MMVLKRDVVYVQCSLNMMVQIIGVPVATGVVVPQYYVGVRER